MTELLSRFADIWGGSAFVALAVFLRVGAAMAMMPAFGEQMVPARVRLALTLAFTAVVLPAVAPDVAAALGGPDGGGLNGGGSDTGATVSGATAAGERGAGGSALPALWLGTEAAAGLMLGLSLRLFVMALQMAGSIIAQATSLAQMFGGIAGEPMPAVSGLLTLAGLALAVMSGLHLRIVEALILSYRAIPPGAMAPADIMAEWGIAQIAAAFGLAFSLAAPFLIAALLYQAALGVMNRAMPQLMVSFVGAPAQSAGGLVLMGLCVPLLLPIWWRVFSAHIGGPLGGLP